LGRTQDAIADARMAQSINQANQTSNAQLASSLPGTLQMMTGADTEAVNAAMNRLSINLPMSVAGIDPVKRSLHDLSREPCDRQAIVNLGLALEKVGRKREAASAQVSFSGACGGHAPSLKSAASALLDLSDYAGAAAAASDLIKLEPFDDSGYYLRAVAHDRSGSAKKAIDDYLTALELFGNKVNLSSDIYLAIARNYEKLGQFCDAESSVESWVALNPARNDSSRMQAIIADYTTKGRCDSAGSRSEEVFKKPQNNIVKLPVVINGVRGTFILDTGATFVSLKEAFAQKAKVQIDQDSKVRMHTANGIAEVKRGRAATIQLRSLQAKDVAIVVQGNMPGSLGDGVDGLLGMSFLSRFRVSIDTQAVKIASRNAK
jgi:aspartyl protease family protein